LKRQAKTFLNVLRKNNVSLNPKTGDVDYTKVKEENVINALKK